MFGEGISFLDLTQLLNAIRTKNLILQVKVINDEWQDISTPTITKMIKAITTGAITNSDNIKLRLFAKNATKAA